MIPRLITSGVLAAIAGAAMTVAVSSSPSFAFTLSSPSVTDKVTKADVQQVGTGLKRGKSTFVLLFNQKDCENLRDFGQAVRPAHELKEVET